MTRQEMRSQVQRNLREYIGDMGANDPWSLDEHINSATDSVARLLDAYYIHYSAPLVSGQQTYCLPDLYKDVSAQILDATGQIQILGTATPQMFDSITGAWWRQNPETTGQPAYYLTEGVMRCLLYPVPNYSADDALIFEGCAVPGTLWATATTECPLPERMHSCIVAKATVLRAEMVDEVTDRRMRTLQGTARRLMGELEGEAYTMTAAVRAGRAVRTRYNSYTW